MPEKNFSQYEECQSEMDANEIVCRCKVALMPMGHSGYCFCEQQMLDSVCRILRDVS
jgi:hypothetical protein